MHGLTNHMPKITCLCREGAGEEAGGGNELVRE